MKYSTIDNQLFIANRKKYTAQLKPKSLAIFTSNDIMPTSGDGTMAFKQHSDIFYLCGADQEESILVLCPEAFDPNHREILFLRETNEHIMVWEGHKLSKEQATAVSGIKTVLWLKDLETILKNLTSQSEHIYLNSNEHLRATIEVETREVRFAKWCRETYPLHTYQRSAPIMHNIRSVKHGVEIELMQQACNITEKGFRRLLNFVKPGVWEHEIEAELIHEFIRNRANGFAYGPIIASGESACILHYTDNNRICKDGDVLLLDVAAEYANYDSDLSRSIPVSGRFTARQKAVYNAVLRVKKAAEKMLIPGTLLNEYQAEVGRIMQGELVDLGLIDHTDIKNQDPAWPAYKKYFMHGTSHYIGLDTHDVGSWTQPIQANMIFTCEPGIYIPEENLGIRLEDNLVVQENGAPFNLMANIPIEADEIEELMNC